MEKRNIHLIPTYKPSRLHIAKNGDYHYSYENVLHLVSANDKPHNIYITNSEEIKEGEYGLSRLGEIIKFHSGYDYRYYAKIILTTDQDLIKDGVQAIDDEFLEWFVKNPSCESVEIDTYSKKIGVETDTNGYREMDVFGKDYRIIIPQEETKQENRKVCKCKRAYENPLSEICSLCWNELYPNEKDEIKEEDLLEPKQETCMFCEGTGQIVSSTTISGFKTCDCINIPKQEQKQHLIDLMRLEKQETLEEAAEKRIPTSTKVWDLTETRRNDFIAGAKSDAARDYWFEKFKDQFKDK